MMFSPTFWKSIWDAFSSFTFRGTSSAQTVGKSLAIIGLLLLPYALLIKEFTWRLEPLGQKFTFSLMQVISYGSLFAWFWMGVGYAIAKRQSATLVIGDKLEEDTSNSILRFRVSCVGNGTLSPRVRVINVLRPDGTPITSQITWGLELEWTHFRNCERPRLKTGNEPESVSVLRHNGTDNEVQILGCNHKQEIANLLQNGTTYTIVIEIADENLDRPITKQFTFHYRSDSHVACYTEAPPPGPELIPKQVFISDSRQLAKYPHHRNK